MSKKGCVLLVAVIVVGVVAYAFVRTYRKNKNATPPVSTEQLQEQEGVPVEFDKVTKMDFPEQVGFWGDVESMSGITMLAETNGTISKNEFKCEVGREIAAGEVIMSIDNPDLSPQMKQAQAALSAARSNLSLVQDTTALTRDAQIDVSVIVAQSAVDQAQAAMDDAKLDRDRILALIFPEGNIPDNPCGDPDDSRFKSVSRSQCNKVILGVTIAEKQLGSAKAGLMAAKEQKKVMVGGGNGALKTQVNAASAGVNQASAAVQLMSAQESKTIVSTPVAGKVTMKMVDPGAKVFPGSPLCMLQTGAGGMKAVFKIGERDAALVNPGDEMELEFSANPAVPIKLKVTNVYPMVDQMSRQVTVEAEITESDLAPLGEYAQAIKPGATFEGTVTARILPGQLAVVYSALVFKEDVRGVYVIEDGKAKFVQVKATFRSGDRVLIEQGLQENQIVAATGGERLFDGIKVKEASGEAPKPPESKGAETVSPQPGASR